MKIQKLPNGDSIPALGLGTWKSQPGEVEKAICTAIEIGYRHFDCAAIYGNEAEIGSAIVRCIKEGIVKREELWITSKLWNTCHASEDVKPALEKTLADLQLDYLDLYLMHWPVALKKDANLPPAQDDFISVDELPLSQTWAAMETLVDLGLTKNIGVSNFNISKLKNLLKTAKLPIANNQVEMHPYLQQKELLEFCTENEITVTAYCPLGSPDRPARLKKENDPVLLEDESVLKIAEKLQCSTASVLIAWALQRGTIVIPKSVTPSRLKENLEAAKLELLEEDLNTLNKLEKNQRYGSGAAWVIEGSPYSLEYLWGDS